MCVAVCGVACCGVCVAIDEGSVMCSNLLQYVAVCVAVCVAVFVAVSVAVCSLQCVALRVAVCVLQWVEEVSCTATCCIVLQNGLKCVVQCTL